MFKTSNNSDNWVNTLANNLFGGSLNAEARGLNNSKDKQTIYLWDNEVKALDVPGRDSQMGAVQMQIYNRNNTSAQRWGLWNSTQEIRSEVADNRCLDISGANYTDGARIQLWECYGGQNQKWFFDGTSLRSWSRPEFCLDVSAGNIQNDGSKIQLYTCNNTSAQRFVAGDYNWGSKFDVNINAKNWGNGGATDPGHVFLSYYVNNNLVNTQSSRPGWDNESDRNCENFDNRINNNCDNDAAWIDASVDIWDARNNTGPGKDYRVSSRNISKKNSDMFRYNSAYRQDGWDYGRDNINYVGGGTSGVNQGNCVTFSVRVWNKIMKLQGYGLLGQKPSGGVAFLWTPNDIYNTLSFY